MAFTEALRLLITADSGGAVRGINAVGAATDKQLGRSQKTIDKWGKGLTTAGAGMIAFGSAALFGLGKAAMASEEANLATVKLQNSIKNNPALAGESSKSFIDLAQAIQGKTAADGDSIVAGMAVLAQTKLQATQIKELTPLVVDLARKKGIDEVSAFQLAAKAVNGNAGALKRSGIQIDEAKFKTDAFGATVDALSSSVGGFAEQEGKTFAGSLERLKNQMGDVVEGVGAGAVDAFTDLFSVVGGGLTKFEQLSPAVQGTIGKFATFGSVALIAAGALSFTIGQLIKMRDNFSLARSALADFAGSGGLGRLARVTVVVGGLIALREVLMSLDKDVEGIDVSKLENQLLDLAESGEFAGDKLKDIIRGFGEALASGDPQELEAWSNQIDKVDEALAQLASRDPKAAAAAFDEIARSLEDQGATADQVKSKFNDYASAVASADTASRTAKGGTEELAGGMGEVADATSEAEDATKEYLDTLSALFDPLFGATDALMDNHQASVDVAVAQMELAAAQKEHGASSTEAAEAQAKLTDAQLKSGKSALDVKQAMVELAAAVDTGTVNVHDAKVMLNEWVAQGLISHDTAMILAAQFDTTAAAADKLGDTDPTVTVSEKGGSATRGSLTKVQQAAVNAGRQRPNIRVGATDRASGTFNIVRRAAQLLDGTTATVYINVSGAAAAANALARAGRQHGGPVHARETYVVGEAGPELLIMGNQSGTIIPNGGVGRPMGGVAMSGGGSSLVVNVDLRGAMVTDRDRFVRDVATAVNKGARMGLVNR